MVNASLQYGAAAVILLSKDEAFDDCNRRWPAAADAAITAARRCQRQPGFETISRRQPAAADAVTNGRPAVATVG